MLEVTGVVAGYQKNTVLNGISFSAPPSEILCLLGPNGVGKTTLFKTILGLIKLKSGSITVDGEDTRNWPRKKYGQTIGYVPQTHNPPFPYSVFDVVTMGRTAYIGEFSAPSTKDSEIASNSLEALGIASLGGRVYSEISGGERQLVLIARALAQCPKILIMDEPTANLDFGNQLLVLGRIKKLAEDGMTVIMTTHFPDQAFLCSSKVALLRRDGFEIGEPSEIVTEEKLKKIYGINVKIVETKIYGHGAVRSCVPIIL